MILTYTIFSADRVRLARTVVVDGVEMEVTLEGLAVQLTSGAGTIQLNLTAAQAEGNPFEGHVGETIDVPFGGA